MNDIKGIIEGLDDYESIEITNYTSSTGEVSNFRLEILDSKQVKADDIVKLKEFRPSKKDLEFLDKYEGKKEPEFTPLEYLIQARDALKTSMTKPNKKQSDAQKDAYEYIGKNIKQHKESGDVYVNGYLTTKDVITPTKTKTKKVVSRPLTLAKKILEKKLTSKTYRSFKLLDVEEISVNGEDLVIKLK